MEQSPALIAEATQMQADIWTALGVAGGLIVILITGWSIIDPIVSLLIAGLIVRAAYAVTMHAVTDLTDVRLPPQIRRCRRPSIARRRERPRRSPVWRRPESPVRPRSRAVDC